MTVSINATTAAPSIDVNGNSIFLPTGGGSFALQSMTGWRNPLINPNFLINQRFGTTATTPTGSAYVNDRWKFFCSQASKITCQTIATGGLVGNSTYFQRMSVASAYTLAAGDFFALGQPIEADNVSFLNWGTSRASSVTVGFWARASIIGTYSLAIRNPSGQTRAVLNTYTINVANTWEYKTVTLIPDTACSLISGTGLGFYLWFDLGCGSTYTGSANTVYSVDMAKVTGTVNLVSQTSGSFLDIADVTFDAGNVPSPFMPRPSGVELTLCQRYYERRTLTGSVTNERLSTAILCTGATTAQAPFQYLVVKRAPPTPNVGNITNSVVYDGSGTFAVTSYSIDNAGLYVTNFSLTVASGLTLGRSGMWTWSNATPTPYIEFSSEL